jgi:hypothetical protein
MNSEESKVHKNVGKVINDLMKEGFESKEIAVISLRGMLLPENIMYENELGGQRIVKATNEWLSRVHEGTNQSVEFLD